MSFYRICREVARLPYGVLGERRLRVRSGLLLHYLLVGICGAIVYDYESQEQQSVCTASQCIVFTVVEDYGTLDVGERSCLLFLCSAT